MRRYQVWTSAMKQLFSSRLCVFMYFLCINNYCWLVILSLYGLMLFLSILTFLSFLFVPFVVLFIAYFRCLPLYIGSMLFSLVSCHYCMLPRSYKFLSFSPLISAVTHLKDIFYLLTFMPFRSLSSWRGVQLSWVSIK